VEYLDGQMTSEVRQIGKVDYREVLPPEQFERFSRLRALRKELADKEAVPPYAVFTNEQLAAMARLEAPSLGAIEEIEGVGAAKMKKYGVLFLAALQTGTSAPPAPAGEAPALKNVPEARQIAPQNPADRTRS
jgi:superfamily II DNA helicase RecQ